jgi:L-lactate dehydrogenase complex protein LldF
VTPTFSQRAEHELQNTVQRSNLRRAAKTIGARRAMVVASTPDWEELREAGRAIKTEALGRLDEYLLQFEASATAAGTTVHWASTGTEAGEIVAHICATDGAHSIVKAKSLTTDEIHLNEQLAAHGLDVLETDLAELILQLDHDWSSHIVVPALHRNRNEIMEIFKRTIAPDLRTDEPADLAEAARSYLRMRFLNSDVGISGANFAVAETGSLCLVESEGNGRMCTTLPRVLISVVGIEKVIPRFQDLEVFLQLLPRSATGEQMNPYTSIWTGVTPGDGPEEMHVVLLDNRRTNVLADPVGRDALGCIRCGACLNTCPVYTRSGGHAYGSVYPGPIGAILTPQLDGLEKHASLPYASTLCGACYEVCPVKINIPHILVHLRNQVPHRKSERLAMRLAALVLSKPRRVEVLSRLFRPLARFANVPGWSRSRDLPPPPKQTFSQWWRGR